MNLEKERELFERYEHSKKPCANRNKLFEVFTKDGLDVDEYRYIGKYVCSFMQEKLELWQASANREGYKLVPLEASKACLSNLGDVIFDNFGTTTAEVDRCAEKAYKAMIGAVE